MDMIKRIKEVCMKNKAINQEEIYEEEERKRKLDDKKTKLRKEILKQIDEDEKQKSVLEEEFKKAEEHQKNLIIRQSLNESANKFFNKDYINESQFDSNNEKNPYFQFIYKKSKKGEYV